jgi:ElaB/YqjD/DUF883 family membrane-anchored ribosome-binding protein
MGEKPDTVKPTRTRRASAPRRQADELDTQPADIDIVAAGELTNDVGDAPPADTEAIRDEIEETRAQMSGTIDEIQERLSPRRLVNEAKETVRDATVGKVKDVMNTAGDSAGGIVDRIRENPVPAALIGIGAWWLFGQQNRQARVQATSSTRGAWRAGNGGTSAGLAGTLKQHPVPTTLAGLGAAWWLMERQRSGRTTSSRSYDEPYYGGQWSSETYGEPWTGEAGGGSRGVRDLAGDATEAVTDATERAQQQISEYAERAQERAGEYADRAQTEFDRLLRENPFALGAVAVAVGAAIGMAVPETRKEREWIGEVGAQIVDKAQDLAQGAVDKAQQVAAKMSEAEG